MAGDGNRFDGTAHGVVQARVIYGDVHFHTPELRKPPPKQVPPPTTHYTNNERQLDEITLALQPDSDKNDERPARIVVVQGPPGGGKSETASQWIHQHRDHYPDGLFYASLAAGTRETGLESEALHQFLLAVGYDPEGIPATLSGRSTWFRSWSTGKRVAVLVDDAVSSAQVGALLPGSGRSVVLVTEAGRLGPLRARGAKFVKLDPLSEESARLLVSRIVGEARHLVDESAQVDELIRCCDGSMIALCVAASLLAEFPDRPVAKFVRELSREGRRLAVLSRDENLSVMSVLNTALARQDAQARRVYAAFGQHAGAGAVSLAALVAAIRADEDDVRDALDRLLAVRLIHEVAEDRYIADGLVREHARQFLDDAELGRAMRDRFDAFYVRRALVAGHAVQPRRGWLERIWPELRLEGSGRDPWRWLDAERANLRAVAARLFEDGRDEVCQLAVALWPYHDKGKHVDDMDAINEQAAALAESRGWPFVAGLALVQRGFAFRARGEHDKAAGSFSDAERIAREHGPRELAATAVESLGLSLRDQGNRAEARVVLERNLKMAADLGDPRRIALARMHFGSVADPDRALLLLEEAATWFRQASELDNVAKTDMWRGRRLTELGCCDEASGALNAALEYMVAQDRHFDVAQIQLAFGENALAAGREEAAREHFVDAVTRSRMRGYVDLAEQALAFLDGLS
jgi:tetratricopeptide (TPR) repeat protein